MHISTAWIGPLYLGHDTVLLFYSPLIPDNEAAQPAYNLFSMLYILCFSRWNYRGSSCRKKTLLTKVKLQLKKLKSKVDNLFKEENIETVPLTSEPDYDTIPGPSDSAETAMLRETEELNDDTRDLVMQWLVAQKSQMKHVGESSQQLDPSVPGPSNLGEETSEQKWSRLTQRRSKLLLRIRDLENKAETLDRALRWHGGDTGSCYYYDRRPDYRSLGPSFRVLISGGLSGYENACSSLNDARRQLEIVNRERDRLSLEHSE
ncbi:hypothetical protein QAD02_000117 [Eretmocerus hayati]|uniref:Uncharacterized protein n=1 Tax=Eretmocerus hayati TaxID=131215 RepID=A0ACC2NCN2_9HYME|nr:hypothetical protein QAD02_000117 [Eretmocerus hayati]